LSRRERLLPVTALKSSFRREKVIRPQHVVTILSIVPALPSWDIDSMTMSAPMPE
jgi:hypothetical protein